MVLNREEEILVVDDDAGVACLERRSLERRGFKVTSVGSRAEALEVLLRKAFDLIVTDYRLDCGTGLELLAHVNALGLDIPAILVTGHSDETVAIEAIRYGVRDFVPKSEEYLRYLPDSVDRVLKAINTERELARTQARFQLFMDHSPAAAFIKDEQGRFVFANNLAQKLIGRSDWEGKTDSELWSHEVAETLRANDLAVLKSNHSAEFREKVLASSGDVLHLQAYKFPMENARGQKFLGCMAIDVTKQTATEEALKERDEQLRQSQKMEAVGTLAGGIAHEFNNLLQAVLGYTRFAIGSIDAGHQAQSDLQIVVSAAERAALLTQQLLTFSRRDEGQRSLLDINETIQDLVQMIRPLVGGNIAVELTLQETIEPILADHAQIQQMLMNLCVNARDAMPQGGTITISTKTHSRLDCVNAPPIKTERQHVDILVSDTGCGMAPEIRKKIFEPFFTTKPVGKGTGLGLAMVYGVVQQHGGIIDVHSEQGVGTTFSIRLPCSTVELLPEPSAPAVYYENAQETILIAEDEPLVLELTMRILQNAGYKLLIANDGYEAVQVYQKNSDKIDLIILDAMMPNLTGREAFQQIRKLGATAPVVFMTGYDRENSPLEGDCDTNHLQKPFSNEQLLSKIRKVLEDAYQCMNP